MATIVYPKFIPATEWANLPAINSQEVLGRMEMPRWFKGNIWLGENLTGAILDGDLVLIQKLEPEKGFHHAFNFYFFDGEVFTRILSTSLKNCWSVTAVGGLTPTCRLLPPP